MYKAYSFFVISCVSLFMVYSICSNKNVVEESLIKQDYQNEQIIINEEIKEEIINFVEEEKELMSSSLIIEKEWEVKGLFGTKMKKFKTLTQALKDEAEHLVGFKKFLLDFDLK